VEHRPFDKMYFTKLKSPFVQSPGIHHSNCVQRLEPNLTPLAVVIMQKDRFSVQATTDALVHMKVQEERVEDMRCIQTI
jgi:hypothetical protein